MSDFKAFGLFPIHFLLLALTDFAGVSSGKTLVTRDKAPCLQKFCITFSSRNEQSAKQTSNHSIVRICDHRLLLEIFHKPNQLDHLNLCRSASGVRLNAITLMIENYQTQWSDRLTNSSYS